MKISVRGLAKNYNQNRIFGSFDFDFLSGGKYVVTGRNGSGKSTLLKILALNERHSSGTIEHFDSSLHLLKSKIEIIGNISFTAPYFELIEEFTIEEAIHFHFKFKQAKSSLPEAVNALQKCIDLSSPIKNLSNGWKQRLKLLLCFESETEVLILDEPLNNMDADNGEWYLNQVSKMDEKRTLVIASNDKREYPFDCEELKIENFK